MLPIDAKWALLVYGVLQSCLTTGVASAIATFQLTPSLGAFLASWPVGWMLAWLAMLPLVVLASPLIQRAAVALVRPACDERGVNPEDGRASLPR